jgi:hypothetical protein
VAGYGSVMTVMQEGETDVSFLGYSKYNSTAAVIVQKAIVERITGWNTFLKAAFIDKTELRAILIIVYDISQLPNRI